MTDRYTFTNAASGDYKTTSNTAGSGGSATDTPYDRFLSLTKRLLHVSKDDVREAEARQRDKRRTA